jgi:cyclophilin family peptidyl-prolyl cis-trans isomerase
MSTAKRERQRENRRLRLAADEAAAKQYATRRRVKLIGIAAVAVAAALAVLGFLQRNNSEPEPVAEPAEPAVEPAVESADEQAAAACPAVDGSSPRTIDFDSPQPMCIDPEARYVAVFDTSEGEMRFDLSASETPLTVNNFVTLARWGYYDGTLLFRTDPSIDIVQGGSPHTNDNRDPGPGYTIPDEPAFDVDPETGGLTGPYRYQPGQLVMARSAGPDSASAQFFLTTGPNASRLDGQGTYVVFGQTDDAGLAVARSIIGLHEPGGSLGGAPSRDVTVHSVTIEET